MRNDHKLNVWPTPPGRAPSASVAPAACLDDRRKNDNSAEFDRLLETTRGFESHGQFVDVRDSLRYVLGPNRPLDFFQRRV